MTISLTPQTQKLLDEHLKLGQYASADELVRAALQALSELNDHKLDDATLDAIDRAEDQIERGQVHDWPQVRQHVRARFLGQ